MNGGGGSVCNMDALLKLNVKTAKVARYETNYLHCIICQEDNHERLVEKPAALGKVLDFIRERAKYGDGNYPEISRRLGTVSAEYLQSKNAKYHRKCYQETVHVTLLKRAIQRYEEAESTVQKPPTPSTFTRSQSTPFKKDYCFFCHQEGTARNPLHLVSSDNAGKALKEAVDVSGNEKLCVKLSTAIDMADAHAIDIKYHKKCWTSNVINITRKRKDISVTHNEAGRAAAEIEFLSLVEGELLDGAIVTMAELQDVFEDILCANDVDDPHCSRKNLKKLLQNRIHDIQGETKKSLHLHATNFNITQIPLLTYIDVKTYINEKVIHERVYFSVCPP